MTSFPLTSDIVGRHRRRALRHKAQTKSPRRHLSAIQRGEVLHACVELRNDITVLGVWLSVRNQWVQLQTNISSKPTQNDGTVAYELEIELCSIPARAGEVIARSSVSDAEESRDSPKHGTLFSGETIAEDNITTSVIDGTLSDRSTLYLEVSSPASSVMGGAIFVNDPPDDVLSLESISYRVTLGRFVETHLGPLHQVSIGNARVTPYVNRRGVLGVRLNAKHADYQRIVVSKLRMSDGVLVLEGHIFTRHSRLKSSSLLLTARGLPKRWQAPLRIHRDYDWEYGHYGHARYGFSIRMSFASLISADLPADVILDAWIQSDTRSQEDPHVARIGRTPYLIRQLSNWGGIRGNSESTLIVPYYTMKAKSTSFRLERFDTRAFDLLVSILRRPFHAAAPSYRKRPVWIIGEQPQKAQDTGLAFFRYLRQHHKEIDAYYVVDPSAPEASNLAGLDHVVDYRSPEHVRLALMAERFVGSHHASYLYPTRAAGFERQVRARHIFLQHGVIAMKWMASTYAKSSVSFNTDLFIVSSEREKQFIVQDLGYANGEVAVTGLSRFDTLFDQDVVVKQRQVLIMPTWRDWLHNDAQFASSNYLSSWLELLESPRFRGLVQQHNLDVIFNLHPNMQPYAHYFDDAPVRTVVQGETDVQRLLKESGLLITDYSSVAWDFSFLHKPVLFFQFDRSRMFRRAQPHMDMDSELPGPAAMTASDLIDELSKVTSNGLQMAEEYKVKADRYIAYRDTNNCERIFAAVESVSRPHGPGKSGIATELRALSFKVFRRSKRYHPLMRAAYRVLSFLPPDPQVVVFESGLGRQINDSPKAMYDELIRRDDPRLRVWSVRGRAVMPDPRTKVVKRYSPEYFWYLGRAKYWVSNQNLPHYLTRGRNRVYLQTWHGTPLKKMAADIDKIHGRDGGYLSRVTTAAAQWSVLVSPSAYATQAIRSAYRYAGPVVELGYPRNDILAAPDHDDRAGKVRRMLGVPDAARTVLYAPTFRDDQSVGGGRFKFELPFSLERFHNELGPNVVLMLRMHSLVAGKIKIPEHLREFVIDASSYPDIQELFLASDLLVTDYSSVFFDFSLLKRPMVFFAYDLDLYRDDLRGFYLDYETTVPGPVETTETGFLNSVAHLLDHPQKTSEEISQFVGKYNPEADGRATERAVDLMLSLGEKKSKPALRH